MYYLCVDTSNGLMLALFRDKVLLEELRISRGAENISDQILVYIDAIFGKYGITFTNLSFMAFIRGPGYFTGIRMGVLIAKILNVATQIPSFGFSFFDILVKQAISSYNLSNKYIITTCDIGKTGAIVAVYDDKKLVLAGKYLAEDEVENFFLNDLFIQQSKESILVGNKQSIFNQVIQKVDFTDIVTVDAKTLVQAGLEKFFKKEKAEVQSPLYVKSVDITLK